MDEHGFGQVAFRDGAESGAPCLETDELDPDLARVVEAWPTLADHVRTAILELVADG